MSNGATIMTDNKRRQDKMRVIRFDRTREFELDGTKYTEQTIGFYVPEQRVIVQRVDTVADGRKERGYVLHESEKAVSDLEQEIKNSQPGESTPHFKSKPFEYDHRKMDKTIKRFRKLHTLEQNIQAICAEYDEPVNIHSKLPQPVDSYDLQHIMESERDWVKRTHTFIHESRIDKRIAKLIEASDQFQSGTAQIADTKTFSSSIAWAPHGIASVLGQAEKVARELGYDFTGVDGLTWKFANEYGTRFGAQLPGLLAQARDPVAMANILETLVQINGVDKVTAFLRENEYSIQLDAAEAAKNSLPVAAASIMDILVEWAVKGEKTKIKLQGTQNEVDAVKILSGRGGRVGFYSSPKNPGRLIIELKTKSADSVFMTDYDGNISDGLGLGELVANLSASRALYAAQSLRDNYAGAVFPMVDFRHQGKIDWLIGVQAPLPDSMMYLEIRQALIEQRLRINEQGARAQQAVAVLCYTLGPPPPQKLYVLDGNQLVVWFERPDQKGKSVIPYSAFVLPKHMKNPKTLA